MYVMCRPTIMHRRSSKLPQPPLGDHAHLALWSVANILVVVVPALSIALLHDARSHRVFVSATALLLLSIAALAAVIIYWRRYWFRPADLKRLVSAHGGTDLHVSRSLSGVQAKARMGAQWLLATLNRPILDVLPTWPAFEFSRKLALGPVAFMRQGARVGLVQIGDFSRFPEVDIRVSGEPGSKTAPSGDKALDRAIQTVLRVLKDSGVALRLEVRPEWLQIEVEGGAWLGDCFTRRIELLFAFSRRLFEQLRGLFVPTSPDDATVDQQYVRPRSGRAGALFERRLRVVPYRNNNSYRASG